MLFTSETKIDGLDENSFINFTSLGSVLEPNLYEILNKSPEE